MSTKISNSNHNQVIINIATPHVQLPGVQILRPEEIKELVEKEKGKQRAQKLDGKYLDIIKYDFIVRKEDIEAGVLGNTPENPKKNLERRPMTGQPRKKVKKETKMEKLARTMANMKVKKVKANARKGEDEGKNEEPQEVKEDGENGGENQVGEEKEEKAEVKPEKEEDFEGKVEEQQEENIGKEESFEMVENQEDEEEMNAEEDEKHEDEDLQEEIEEEEGGQEKAGEEPEEEKTIVIEKKKPKYQSGVANLLQDMYTEFEESESMDSRRSAKKSKK